MSNIFDWSQAIMGVQNPSEEMAKYADRQQQQNRAAIGLDANGNPLPPPDAAQAASTLPPNQQPNAVKSDPSMGRMIVDLQRYNERKQTFDSSLGGVFAALSQPRNREMMSHAFDVNLADPTKLGQSIMAVSSQQQGQDRMNAMGQMISDPVKGAALARDLGLASVAELRAAFLANPEAVARMVEEKQRPTPVMAEVDQATRWMQQQGWDPQRIKDTQSLIMTGVVKNQDLQQMELDRQAYKTKHGVDPPWAGDPTAWKQSVINTQQLNESVNGAREIHGKNIAAVNDMNNRVREIKNNPALDGLLKERGYKKQAAQNLLLSDPLTPLNVLIKSNFPGVTFTEEEKALIDNIRQLRGQEYMASVQKLGMSRPTQAEISGIQNGFGQVQNLDLDPDTYKTRLDEMDEALKSLRANSFGASQNFNDMPTSGDDDLRPYVDEQYTKGGTRNLEGSGSEAWADKVKATPEQEAQAAEEVKAGHSRSEVARYYRQHGVRLKGY